MVNVLITIDTEVTPRYPDWREAKLARDIARDIDGVTESGEFGVAHQMHVLNAHGLKGVLFVEPLFALTAGLEPLRRLVQLIERGGHEVQMHLHTEWLEWLNPSPLPGRVGEFLKEFSLEEQSLLISRGLQLLHACGANDIRAFRAGNYGANLDTLRALARNGIRYDSSHNFCYLNTACDMRGAGMLLSPAIIHGVCEIPISFFRDWPGHHRHAQLCAISSGEMEHALLQAWKTRREFFVIVSHSFELIRDRYQVARPARPDRIVIRRFERLCRFLSENRDKFCTRGFAEIDGCPCLATAPVMPLRSGIHRTAWRVAEQLMRRIL